MFFRADIAPPLLCGFRHRVCAFYFRADLVFLRQRALSVYFRADVAKLLKGSPVSAKLLKATRAEPEKLIFDQIGLLNLLL